MIDDVKERLHESITLRDVANRFSFSPNYLGVLFKEETGQNFSDYVIALRMEKARELLSTTKLKIYEVAAQTGYQYLPYFSRQFKETYGMTPLEYRRVHQ
ncbi:helix-turn-helix transcriptional regulator [Paenibacillus sp. DMB20]|uniref:helix-turn-helix transcriptional regulator n=1 Tax=Paenibacillus sp. DMB20 TaxID=1642570 RepID=UPI000A3F6366